VNLQKAIHDDSITGIVITATAPGFVMGADLNYLIKLIHADQFDRIHYYTDIGNSCFDLIDSSPKPVVAAVNGSALGGGFELALACDYRIAAANAGFSLPETGLGICPLWGGIPRLEALLGTALAKWLVYTGKQISAPDAHALQIIEAVVPAEQLLEQAIAKALQPETPVGTHAARRLETEALIRLFGTQTVESLFHGPASQDIKDPASLAVKQLKKRSLSALKFSEAIFAAPEFHDSNQRNQFYREIVEVLYRSEDAMIGLEWKQQKKLSAAPFTNKSI
jgi:enoyl-CoA hydratase/carnithine racemase